MSCGVIVLEHVLKDFPICFVCNPTPLTLGPFFLRNPLVYCALFSFYIVNNNFFEIFCIALPLKYFYQLLQHIVRCSHHTWLHFIYGVDLIKLRLSLSLSLSDSHCHSHRPIQKITRFLNTKKEIWPRLDWKIKTCEYIMLKYILLYMPTRGWYSGTWLCWSFIDSSNAIDSNYLEEKNVLQRKWIII